MVKTWPPRIGDEVRSRLESPGWDSFVATKTLPLLKQLRKRPADVRQFDLEKLLNTFFCCPPKIGKQLLAIVNKHNKKSKGRKRWHRFIFNSTWQEISFIDGLNFHPAFSSVCKHSLNCPKKAETPKWGWAGFFPRPKNLPLHNTPTGRAKVSLSSFRLHSKNRPVFFTAGKFGKENSTKQGKDESMSSSLQSLQTYLLPVLASCQQMMFLCTS